MCSSDFNSVVGKKNKTIAQQSALIKKCRDAMATLQEQYPHIVKGYWYDALAAIETHQRGSK